MKTNSIILRSLNPLQRTPLFRHLQVGILAAVGGIFVFAQNASADLVAEVNAALPNGFAIKATATGVTPKKVAATTAQLQAAITGALGANGHTAADGGAFVTAVLGEEPATATGRTGPATAIVAGVLNGIASLSPTDADYVSVARAAAAANYGPAIATAIATAQKNAFVAVMKATLPATPLTTTTPTFTTTNALAAEVVKTTFIGAAVSDANTDQQVAVLAAMIAAVPAATAGTNTTFTAAAKLDAIAGLGGAVTDPTTGARPAGEAGVLAGRLARTLATSLDAITRGMATNLTTLSNKTAFAVAAASQHTTTTGAILLSDAVKNSIAVGVSRTAATAADQGDVIAAVGGTMSVGDTATTVAAPLDIRRATIAKAVITMDATNFRNAPAIVEQMLKTQPLDNPSALWGTSSTVTVAAKFATTLTGAIPAVSIPKNITLMDKTDAIKGATVSINDQYTNTIAGLDIKVKVAQAVIGANTTLILSITQAVAEEAFNNASGFSASGYSGTTAERKATFVKALALGLSDANKGLVAAGATLVDTSLAGQIVLQVGDAPTSTAGNTITPTSRANVAIAVAKAVKTNVGLNAILEDIASTGASTYGSADPVNQANFGSVIITSLGAATSGFNATNIATAVSHGIANHIASDVTDSNAAADALAFVGKLASLQKANAVRIGTIVTAVAPVFATQIPLLAQTVTTNALTSAVNIATAAANYSPSDAVAIATSVAGVPGVVPTAASGIFTATATAAAGTQSTLPNKAIKVGAAAQAVLAFFQASAGNLALAAAAMSGSILDNDGRATVAGNMASALTGAATTISLNSVAVADNLAKSVGTPEAKGDIAAAVIAAQPATVKAVIQKVAVETGLTTVTLKAQVVAEVVTKLPAMAGPAAAALATTPGVLAADAQTVANVIATGRTLTKQIEIAYAVAGAQSAQASNVAKNVLNLSLTDLNMANGYAPSAYLIKAGDYASVAAQYASQFSTSLTASIAAAAPDIAGEAAGKAALDVTAGNLNELAKIFGSKLSTAASATTFTYSTAGKIGTGVGTELQKSISGAPNNPLTEEFAAVAIALTHFINSGDMTKDITYIKAVGTALATINQQAAPDVLGVIISDLISRGVVLTKTNVPIVGALKTALTIASMSQANKDALTAVVNDIFDGVGGAVGSNPYGTYGSITGLETTVHNL